MYCELAETWLELEINGGETVSGAHRPRKLIYVQGKALKDAKTTCSRSLWLEIVQIWHWLQRGNFFLGALTVVASTPLPPSTSPGRLIHPVPVSILLFWPSVACSLLLSGVVEDVDVCDWLFI